MQLTYQSSRRIRINDFSFMTINQQDVQDALKRLSTLTPLNLHLKTNADFNVTTDFESVWSRHGAQAARYLLLPFYWEGRYGGQPEHYAKHKFYFNEDLESDVRDSPLTV
jgi:hypothetical protein